MTPSFADACALVETALGHRREILDGVTEAKDAAQAMTHLRDGMSTHVWKAGTKRIELRDLVDEYDTRTRRDGFHILHDWDGKAVRVNEDSLAVEVLDFIMARRGDGPPNRAVLAILLDYYFLYLLALFAIRIWDDGDPGINFDRLNSLGETLQGPGGSGQPFTFSGATLLVIAGSHYEAEDRAYDALLEKVQTLSPSRRAAIALAHVQALGGHLRFGFEATYGRDITAMRDDNGVDYAWLCFSLTTVMGEYARLGDTAADGPRRDTLTEAILNGLSADAAAFLDENPPRCLAAHAAERANFREQFLAHRAALLADVESHRPSERAFSPISFFFNFSQNALKGTIVDALLWGEPWPLALDDLFTAIPREPVKDAARTKLATTLMGYARANPDTIRGRLMPAIVYDPMAGRRAFSAMMRVLRA